ncbi:hypothetical protein NL676_028987 [Syzygium grande]|nr:hypothetical protein NL676_028987 [Syzygium grande]
MYFLRPYRPASTDSRGCRPSSSTAPPTRPENSVEGQERQGCHRAAPQAEAASFLTGTTRPVIATTTRR